MRIDGPLNKGQYMDIIHWPLLPFVEGRHSGTSNFILQEDNCGPLGAINVENYVAPHGVRRLAWAPQSPNMNPFENA